VIKVGTGDCIFDCQKLQFSIAKHTSSISATVNLSLVAQASTSIRFDSPPIPSKINLDLLSTSDFGPLFLKSSLE
jgi:hypothetical protein